MSRRRDDFTPTIDAAAGFQDTHGDWWPDPTDDRPAPGDLCPPDERPVTDHSLTGPLDQSIATVRTLRRAEAQRLRSAS